MSFPRYAAYKDSGIEWLGEVPEGWDVKRLKNLASIHNGSDYKHIESEDGYPVIGSGGEFTKASEYIYSGESVLLGRKGTIDKPLYINGAFWTVDTMFYTKIKDETIGRYLYYCTLTIKFDLYSTSTALPSMTQADLLSIVFAIPCKKEQTTIAAFLDCETSKIDNLINEQKKLIELLKEKRQALALSSFQANSIELRLDDAVDIMSRPVLQKDDETYVPIGLFNRGRGLFHKEPRTMSEMGDSDFFWIEEGDLIISGQFAWEGAVAMAGSDENGCVASHRYPILRGKTGLVRTEYIFALLTTKHGDFLLNESSRGAAGRNKPLNINVLLKEKIKIPSMAIQDEIAKLVQKEKFIQNEINNQEQLLKERRTALISAAVTGKIDVRNKSLPASL